MLKLKLPAPPKLAASWFRDFYTGEGDNYRTAAAQANWSQRLFFRARLLDIAVHLRKLRVRGSIDYPLAGVAVAVKRSNGHIEDIQIALTAVNPAPVLVAGSDALC